MHLRRALLLFAMVLGFAALAATISQAPRRNSETRPAAAAPLPRGAAGAPGEVRLAASNRPRTVRLRAGVSATLVVAVPEPGQVELEGLGLLSAAEPSTPATFPVSLERGRHRVVFTPAGSADERTVGTVRVRR